MQVPVEIAFHNIQSSQWAEEAIRERVAKLETIFDRIVTCRVRVDQRAKNALSVPPVIRIEIGVPGHKDIVVSHEPEHLQQKFQTPDIRVAINEAFRIAERQLLDFKEQLKGRTKAPQRDIANQFLGQIAEMDPAGDFGFLLTKEGGMLYFHRNSLLAGDFDRLKRGDQVHYVEDVGDTGPIAVKVRVKAMA
ncbi:HPF/RaiA family ribosome-associated protein [Flaviflagellibacter deserti]|jgi:ribosome-associated translation inhibitor RaiA/cold shock CspA family protein|uniref:HPF/RaiA family ribosome-associated protein n=1 Tax=Flaviflagellibacter deserti TaxID=2267266 RepID=A0ABV9Z5P5_9HYPH